LWAQCLFINERNWMWLREVHIVVFILCENQHLMQWQQKWRVPKLFNRLKYESKVNTTEKQGVRGTLLGSQHFGGVEGRVGAPGWDYEKWQASTTHKDLHITNTRWLVHNWSTFGVKTSHEQFEFTRLTMA
jgi:hypothetical protein